MPSAPAQSSLSPKPPCPKLPQPKALPFSAKLSLSAKQFPSRLCRLPRQRGARSVQALKGIEAAGAISSREEKIEKSRASKEERPELSLSLKRREGAPQRRKGPSPKPKPYKKRRPNLSIEPSSRGRLPTLPLSQYHRRDKV